MESDHSAWEFGNATLKKASDLEVVRFTPQLIKNLFEQLENELSEEENPQKIAYGLNFLSNNQNLHMQVLAISYKSLREMGEEDPKLVHDDSGQPNLRDIGKIIKAIHKEFPGSEVVGTSSHNSSLDQKKVAIDLFMNKKNLMMELKEIALNMRVSLVEQKFAEIVKEMAEKGIFPVTWNDSMGTDWFGDKKNSFNALNDLEPIYSKGMHKERTWCVSANGVVLEFEKKKKPKNVYEQFPCAEHLLEQAPEILKKLINCSARNFFRKIQV